MKDTIQSFFNQEAMTHLGQAVGMDPTLTQRALSLGLPLQIDALAAHAESPEGRARLGEAVSNLPRFGSVQEALGTPSGAANLQQAGELLAPTLLGGQAEEMVQQVTRRVGGSIGAVQKALNMTLPLVLSLLGRQGMNAVNADTMLGRLRGTLTDLSLGGAVAAAAPAVAAAPEGAATLSANAITPNSLLEMLKMQFSGDAGDKIGRAAGFTGAATGSAVLGALPVVLNAIVNKGKTEAGAAELLKQSQDFDRLIDDNGLNAGLLGDSAEMARLEGQGRGLLGGLFGNVDSLTGRLGTALGGSGANAGRLLALMVPLVLGLLGRTARTSRMSPLVLSGLLGAMGDKLTGLIPAGMTGLTGLLGAGALGAATTAAAQAPVTETVVAKAVPETRVVENVPPAPPAPTPTVVKEPVVTPPPPPVTTTTTERKGGIPWWVWLLPLLLLGGCLMWPKKQTTTTTTTTTTAAQDGGIVVENPASDSTLPAEPFTMSGKAAPDMHLKIEDQGQVVAESTADANGNWTAEIPAPTAGEHTYSIIGGDNAKSEFKVNVAEGDGTGTTDSTSTDTASTDTSSTDTASTDSSTDASNTGTAGDGTFTISEPAESAEVAATGFNLKGTGKPGETYELLEDGTSVGTFKVGDDGNWTADVAAPAEGDKTYTIRDSSGNEVATLPVKVAAGTAATGECTQELSVSLNDGETVTAPFRFGGVGSGKGYAVTVMRNGRAVGTKRIPLAKNCTWSYTSDPGGKSGKVNTITYEVRPLDAASSDEAAATLNLDVKAQ